MFVLLATQRSGTNMLRSILNQYSDIMAFPEVFHDQFIDRLWVDSPSVEGYCYYEEFYADKVAENPTNLQPNARRACVTEYFELLRTIAERDGRLPMIDVKYNSLHHADGTWQNPSRPPVMMEIFRDLEMPILHLRRENHLAITISLLRAQKTNQYVADEKDNIMCTTYSVPPAKLLYNLRAHAQMERLVLRWIKTIYPKCLDVTYESLFKDGPSTDMNPDTFKTIGDFLGIDASELNLHPKTKRLASRSYREEIENFDELADVLKDTPYCEQFLAF